MKMKSQTLNEKMPFYQKVLNLTMGLSSPARKEESSVSSPFRRGYTTPRNHPALPLTPNTMGTPLKTPSSSTAASLFRSFRRRSLRRSFRRTKSFLVKNPSTPTTASPTPSPLPPSVSSTGSLCLFIPCGNAAASIWPSNCPCFHQLIGHLPTTIGRPRPLSAIILTPSISISSPVIIPIISVRLILHHNYLIMISIIIIIIFIIYLFINLFIYWLFLSVFPPSILSLWLAGALRSRPYQVTPSFDAFINQFGNYLFIFCFVLAFPLNTISRPVDLVVVSKSIELLLMMNCWLNLDFFCCCCWGFVRLDSFVNSQEWTLSRAVPDLRLGIVGSLASGKSALVHRYLTGSYMQEESPEGGRFKKEILLDGQSYLLLIRDEGGTPELQVPLPVSGFLFIGFLRHISIVARNESCSSVGIFIKSVCSSG